MSKLSRTKGAVEERRVAALYTSILGTKVQRELSQYQESSGRDLKGCEPWCVQCKHGKRVQVREAYYEAASAVDKKYTIPIAHIHDHGLPPLVVLSEEDWMTIVERLNG